MPRNLEIVARTVPSECGRATDQGLADLGRGIIDAVLGGHIDSMEAMNCFDNVLREALHRRLLTQARS